MHDKLSVSLIHFDDDGTDYNDSGRSQQFLISGLSNLIQFRRDGASELPHNGGLQSIPEMRWYQGIQFSKLSA